MARASLLLSALALSVAVLPNQTIAITVNDEIAALNEASLQTSEMLKQLLTFLTYAEADKQINRSCPPTLRGNSAVPCYAFLESCYCFPRIAVNFPDANAYCTNHGMHLTSIETEAEATMLRLYQQTQNWHGSWYWTSGKRVDGKWKWLSSDRDIVYTNWQGGQPNNLAHELYLSTEPVNQKWHDASENHIAYPICEKSLR